MKRLDGMLREALTAPCGVLGVLVLTLMLLAGELVLTSLFQFSEAADAFSRMMTMVLMLIPFAIMIAFALSSAVRTGAGILQMTMMGVICMASMVMRLSFLDRTGGDFTYYLSDWMKFFAYRSFGASMRENIGEYNVLYQYILFFLTRLPIPHVYGVKWVSFIGDAMLAGAALSLCGDEKRGQAAFAAVLLVPTFALNGGMFAQCDSLYAACALWGLALALNHRGTGAAVCFALSIAFKLQAVFFLPIVLVLFLDEELHLQDALVFLLTLAAVALPAVLFGKNPLELISIYTSQTGLYTGLNYNAPGFYGLMETAGLDAYAYGKFSIALALGACLLLILCFLAEKRDRIQYLRLAVLLPLVIVFFLPRMHERYFYLAEAAAMVLAAEDRRMIPPAMMIAAASLSVYWETNIPLVAASFLMLVSMGYILSYVRKKEKRDD